jgi:ABC-type dipeptide/oligopeptide/nickel transport system permease subunit
MTELHGRVVGTEPAVPMGLSPGEAEGLQEKPESFGRQAFNRFRSHKVAIAGAVILVLVIIMFFIGPEIRPYAFDARNVRARNEGPGTEHWFGTDNIGRDLFVRTMMGGRFSIFIALLTTAVATLIGATLGSIAGYYGGWLDAVISFFTNLFLTIPLLAVLLVFGIRYGTEAWTIALLIAAFIWTRAARIVRGQFLQLKEVEFVQAARASGAGSPRIILRHILPNTMGPILVEFTLTAGAAIILESTLSFLGLGVLPPTPTLGTLVADAKGQFSANPHAVLLPGLFIMLIVLSFNFLGDGLRDALDPTSRTER